jgi:hypothetical protein
MNGAREIETASFKWAIADIERLRTLFPLVHLDKPIPKLDTVSPYLFSYDLIPTSKDPSGISSPKTDVGAYFQSGNIVEYWEIIEGKLVKFGPRECNVN